MYSTHVTCNIIAFYNKNVIVSNQKTSKYDQASKVLKLYL